MTRSPDRRSHCTTRNAPRGRRTELFHNRSTGPWQSARMLLPAHPQDFGLQPLRSNSWLRGHELYHRDRRLSIGCTVAERSPPRPMAPMVASVDSPPEREQASAIKPTILAIPPCPCVHLRAEIPGRERKGSTGIPQAANMMTRRWVRMQQLVTFPARPSLRWSQSSVQLTNTDAFFRVPPIWITPSRLAQ